MSLAISGTLTLGESVTPGANNPRFCYRNFFRDGTVTVSSEAPDSPHELAHDGFLDTNWKPEGAGPHWIQVQRSGSANYFALVTSGLSGVTVRFQASIDGIAWSDLADPIMPVDRVVGIVFDAAAHDYWRVLFDGGDPPKVADVAVGAAMVPEIGFPFGFAPPKQARNNEVLNNTTEQGLPAGRSVIKRGISTTCQLRSVTEEFVRDEWEPFIDHAETEGWYLIWAPVRWPQEIAYVWLSGKPRNPSHSSAKRLDVRINIDGIAR